MQHDVENRVIRVANYIIETRETIRDTAKIFGVSKSTIHNDVSKRLKKINPNMCKTIREILDINFKEKHIRGGEATKIKYLKNHIKIIKK